MSNWVPIKEVDFSKDGNYHIDTRDFHCIFVEEDHVELPEPKFSFSDHKRLKEVLIRIDKESSNDDEDKEWRHLIFQSESGGWLKYIRIQIKEGNIMLYTTFQERFEGEIDINRLDNKVEWSRTHYSIMDGEPQEEEESNSEPVRGYGEVKEFKWKKNRNGNPYREYDKSKW